MLSVVESGAVGMKTIDRPRSVVIEWIDHILERKKWTGTDLARKAGLAPSTILRLLNDPKHQFTPSLKTLQKISEASGYPITRKVANALGGTGLEPGEDQMPNGGRPVTLRPVPTERKPATVELRHFSSLPAALHSTGRKNDTVVCPPQLENDETAFAFLMPDDSFGLWLKSGSLLYATKQRDPISGDLVLMTHKDGRSRVRLLTKIDENGLYLAKTMPITDEEALAFDDIAEIAVVAMVSRISQF
jgi:transcriptional regulator with XRE-family HTH domain